MAEFYLMEYDFDLLSGKVNQVDYQRNKGLDSWSHRYHYDANFRITEVETSRDRLHWESQARYSYYIHGPLMRTELGEERVQGLDYAYTINGWLVGVNGINVNQATSDMGRDGSNTGPHKRVARDAFGFALAYFENSYTPIKTGFIHSMKLSNLTAATNHRDMYNGNISGMSTSMLDESEVGIVTHYHRYRYDQLNRITSSRVGNLFSSDGALPGMYTDQSSTRYSYDANGNILTLDRYDLNGVQFDDFTYPYGTANNRLGHVSDAILSSSYANDLENGQSSGNYSYDADGNLISDAQEGINSITWNVQGKVSKIDKAAGPDLEFRYDPMGQRQIKIVKNGYQEPNWTKNYYIRDPQGNVMATYTLRYEEIDPQARPDEYKQLFSLNEQHVYGSSRLGVLNVNELLYETEIHVTAVGGDGELKEYSYVNDQITYTGVLKTTTRGSKTYELTNHLGNVMSTISDRKVPVDDASNNILYFLPDVDTYQDYFPFGMVMSERSGSENSAGYRYGFNGMEYENKLYQPGNAYDFGARVYDGRIGRWFSVDKLFAYYPSFSDYVFSANNPIFYKDFDGNVIVDANGNIIFSLNKLKDPIYEVINESKGIYFKVEFVTIYGNDGTPIEAQRITKVRRVKEKIEVLNADGSSSYREEWVETELETPVEQIYDCHGLTFLGGNLWLDSPEVDKLLEADGYLAQGVIGQEKAEEGDIFLYCNPNPQNPENPGNFSHSAILNSNGLLDSKNGKEPIGVFTNNQLESKYGDNTDIFKRIPNFVLTKEVLEPNGTKNGLNEISRKEFRQLKKNNIIK